MAALLQIALNSDKQIVSIYQVATGRKCGCSCPECGEELEAKNRGKSEGTVLGENQKVAHFAHVSGKLCKYAGETALHKLAKEVISETKTLLLPELSAWGVLLSAPIKLQFDSVELEKSIVKDGHRIVPDAVLTLRGSQIFPEFYKTHLVDPEKHKKIHAIGVSTIEIHINEVEPIKDGVPNRAEIKELLETRTFCKSWLFNAKTELLRSKTLQNSKAKMDEREKNDYDEARLQEQNWPHEQAERTAYEEFKANKKQMIEEWKDKAISQGYKLLKVYQYGQVIYCPKEKKENNKIDVLNCRMCDHFLEFYYPAYDDTRLLCGFSANLKRKYY